MVSKFEPAGAVQLARVIVVHDCEVIPGGWIDGVFDGSPMIPIVGAVGKVSV
jgi:hypothetical protein